MADLIYPGGAGITTVNNTTLEANDMTLIGTSIGGAAQQTDYSDIKAGIVGNPGALGGVTPASSLVASGNITILSDSGKLVLGAGSDVQFYYDGTTLKLIGDIVAASDFSVDCGTSKTLVLAEPVWEDLNFDVVSAGGVTQPDYVVINNVLYREFTSANNQACGSVQELLHEHQLSTTLYPHLHCFLKSGESVGTTGVTFTFYWELRESGSLITNGSVSLSATSAQLSADTAKINISDATGFTGPLSVGGQLACRIARTAGDAGDVVVMTYGVHYKKDTMGSRQITTK